MNASVLALKQEQWWVKAMEHVFFYSIFCQWLVTLIQIEKPYCEILYLEVPASCQLVFNTSGFKKEKNHSKPKNSSKPVLSYYALVFSKGWAKGVHGLVMHCTKKGISL